MDIALFDFDGTITRRNTLGLFARYAVHGRRKTVASLRLAPWLLGSKLGLVSRTALRQRLARLAFAGRELATLQALGAQFAAEVLPRELRPEAMQAVAWHQSRGDTVVIVSASLQLYLAPWCARHGLALICPELASENGICTGRYAAGDCYGAGKAERVLRQYDLARYDTVYAYGDTEEDRAMLALAQRKYFRGKPI